MSARPGEEEDDAIYISLDNRVESPNSSDEEDMAIGSSINAPSGKSSHRR